jgi:hypothetical protein
VAVLRPWNAFAFLLASKGLRDPKAQTTTELPARTVYVAADTSPNVTYEREYEGTFALDARRQFFNSHTAEVTPSGEVVLTEVAPGKLKEGFFTSYNKGGHTKSRRCPPWWRGF